MLFRDVEQIPDGHDAYIRPGETTFRWIESHERAASVREELEMLFALFPPRGQEALRGRLRSKHRGQFEGARFEMQMFGMLHRMGLEPRYEAPEGGADFLCERFQVEATHVRGYDSGKTDAEEDVILRLRLHFDTSETPLGLWIGLESRGKLGDTPSVKRLVPGIHDAISHFRAAGIRSHYFDIHGIRGLYGLQDRRPNWDENGYGLPVYRHPTEDWTLFVSSIRHASEGHRGGIRSFPSSAIRDDTADRVLNALRGKAKQIRQTFSPLYVAVQVGGLGWDTRDTERVHAYLSRDQSVAGVLLVLHNALGGHGMVQLVSPLRTDSPFEALREPHSLEQLLSF
ncbi:hypothetical protein [Candidatus Palauibacter sp.]|uniref:hypothetical protein n=1 Tax=Candidatus Palauibacter sp. TaxID=3101350 RepID=UPI003B5D056A